jgi:hypothetical protein
MLDAEQTIKHFGMKPLPHEGGYYVETYRCKDGINGASLPSGCAGARSFSTAILCLLTPQTFSALHRIKSDEVFHFYLGDPVTMLELKTDGSAVVLTLGHNLLACQHVQVIVPRNTWQGCFLNDGGKFALMGTTVAPGFESTDLELADRELLLQQYPQQRDMIVRLTRRR